LLILAYDSDVEVNIWLWRRVSMEQDAAGRCGSSSNTASSSSKPSTSEQQQQQQSGGEIPEGLYDLLKGVTVAVLRDRPSDLYSFVADYFTKVGLTTGWAKKTEATSSWP